jgi:hypothetical protein
VKPLTTLNHQPQVAYKYKCITTSNPTPVKDKFLIPCGQTIAIGFQGQNMNILLFDDKKELT